MTEHFSNKICLNYIVEQDIFNLSYNCNLFIIDNTSKKLYNCSITILELIDDFD